MTALILQWSKGYLFLINDIPTISLVAFSSYGIPIHQISLHLQWFIKY